MEVLCLTALQHKATKSLFLLQVSYFFRNKMTKTTVLCSMKLKFFEAQKYMVKALPNLSFVLIFVCCVEKSFELLMFHLMSRRYGLYFWQKQQNLGW